MSATNKDELAKRFTDDVARRHGAGLPQKQLEFLALRQLVADARNCVADREQVREFIIREETALGRSASEAKEHADLVLAGKFSKWAERDYGIKKRPKRHRYTGSDRPLGEDITHRFFPPQ